MVPKSSTPTLESNRWARIRALFFLPRLLWPSWKHNKLLVYSFRFLLKPPNSSVLHGRESRMTGCRREWFRRGSFRAWRSKIGGWWGGEPVRYRHATRFHASVCPPLSAFVSRCGEPAKESAAAPGVSAGPPSFDAWTAANWVMRAPRRRRLRSSPPS